MNGDWKRFFVFTGGPGSGKTTLIQALGERGHKTTVEAGRAIIQEQVAIGGRALPWSDPLLFAELMLNWDMRSYRMAGETEGPVFFDRGVPDVIGYLRLLGLPIPDHMKVAATGYRYNAQVFFAPPWKEIFQQDRERKQDFDEALKTYNAMLRVYSDFGYVPIEIPRAPVEERVRFVLNTLDLSS